MRRGCLGETGGEPGHILCSLISIIDDVGIGGSGRDGVILF